MLFDDIRKVKIIVIRVMVVLIDYLDEEVFIVFGVLIGMVCVWFLKVVNEIGYLSY